MLYYWERKNLAGVTFRDCVAKYNPANRFTNNPPITTITAVGQIILNGSSKTKVVILQAPHIAKNIATKPAVAPSKEKRII